LSGLSRLNPFEIRAWLALEWPHAAHVGACLNPFEIRAWLARGSGAGGAGCRVLIPLKSGHGWHMQADREIVLAAVS